MHQEEVKIHVSYIGKYQRNRSKRAIQKSSGLPGSICRQIHTGRSYEDFKKGKQTLLSAGKRQTEVWGRYSFLGYEPDMEITCTDGCMKIRRTEEENKEEITKQVAHPGDTLREILKEYFQ